MGTEETPTSTVSLLSSSARSFLIEGEKKGKGKKKKRKEKTPGIPILFCTLLARHTPVLRSGKKGKKKKRRGGEERGNGRIFLCLPNHVVANSISERRKKDERKEKRNGRKSY